MRSQLTQNIDSFVSWRLNIVHCALVLLCWSQEAADKWKMGSLVYKYAAAGGGEGDTFLLCEQQRSIYNGHSGFFRTLQRFCFLLFRLLWNINHAHLHLSPLTDNVFCLQRPCHVRFVLLAFWLITNLSITFSLVWTVKISCFLLMSFFICSGASCRRDTFVFLSFLRETARQQSIFYCYNCIALFFS